MPPSLPREGMLAVVRNRRGVVAEVEPFSGGDGGVTHLVTVEYLDPAPPIEERLLWEREVGAELQEATALPQVATLAPMPRFTEFQAWTANWPDCAMRAVLTEILALVLP